MGHEYMEMKNTHAAIQSYRQAIEVNRRDYRAWYGLGQTYEILKMPFYCLYYYKQVGYIRYNQQWGCCRLRSSDPPTAGCWWPWGRAMRSWTRHRMPSNASGRLTVLVI